MSQEGLTKIQAVQAMMEGKKVTHVYFSDNEWMTIENGKILLDDGVKVSTPLFWADRQGKGWEDGYSIFNDKND